MLELMAMEVEDVARALVESIGDDGQPTRKTIELSRDAVLQILDAGDDERRLTEGAAFVTILLRLLTRMAAVATDELRNCGVDTRWR